MRHITPKWSWAILTLLVASSSPIFSHTLGLELAAELLAPLASPYGAGATAWTQGPRGGLGLVGRYGEVKSDSW